MNQIDLFYIFNAYLKKVLNKIAKLKNFKFLSELNNMPKK